MLVYEKKVENARHIFGTLEGTAPSATDTQLIYKDSEGTVITPELNAQYFDNGKGGIKDADGEEIQVFIEDTRIIPKSTTPPTPSKSVVSIAVTNMPLITEYEEGEELNLTGLEVTATYDDSTTAVVEGYTTVPSNGEVLTEEDVDVAIFYKGKTTSFNITVVAVIEPKSVTELKAALAEGGDIRLAADMVANECLKVSKDTYIDFNGHKISNTEPFFASGNTANLMIDSATPVDVILDDVNIESLAGDCYSLDVRGNADTTVTIKSGSMKGDTSAAQVVKGKLVIEDGDFSVHEGEYGGTYLLNCIDAAYQSGEAKIEVKGGTFHNNFNPADNASEGEHTNYVPTGYKSTDNGDGSFTVTAE